MSEELKNILRGKMKDAIDYINVNCKPLLEKDKKIAEPYRAFEKAWKDRVEEVNKDSK